MKRIKNFYIEIEEERLRKEENERLALEELHRLEEEEKNLIPWKNNFEQTIRKRFNQINEKEDWDKYSNCDDGYINVRKENELNSFLNEFKENCDSVIL